MSKLYTLSRGAKAFIISILFIFFLSSVNAQVDYPIGTGTTGNNNTSYPAPLHDWFEGSRMQYLYRASELIAAGMGPGNINAIKFEVISLGTSTNTNFEIQNYEIKIGATSTASLDITTWETGAVTKYGPFNYLPVVGINTFNFTTPFFWNGVDNILIEICNGAAGNDQDIFYTGNSVVPWTTGLSFNGSHNYRADNLGNLCGTTTTTHTGDETTRPNIIFNWAAAVPCTSPPAGGTATASPGAVCGGEPVNLNLTGIVYGTGQTYSWESSDNVAGPFVPISTPSVSPAYVVTAPTSNTFYRAAVTCSGNTTYSVPIEVVVNSSAPTPVINTTPTGNICNGSTVVLSTPECAGCTYSWNSGEITNEISVTNAGFYTVTVSNSCGTGVAAEEIILDPSPSLSISAGTDLCAGSSVTLTANGASEYSWSPATGLNTTTGASVIATPATTTTYTVTGSIGNCSQTKSVTITVIDIPATPTVSASGATAFCEGGNVTFTSSAASGNQWYKNGVAIVGATTQTYLATESGSYTVNVSSGTCVSNTSTGNNVVVTPVPVQPTINQNGNVLQSSSATGNQWYLNGTPIPGASNQTYTPTASGQYTVQVTSNGCMSAFAAVFNLTITATNDPVLNNDITIAPNPVSGLLTIKYDGNPSKFSFILMNVNGAVLSKGSFTSTQTIDMTKYSSGMYFIRIINDRNGSRIQRMILKQ